MGNGKWQMEKLAFAIFSFPFSIRDAVLTEAVNNPH